MFDYEVYLITKNTAGEMKAEKVELSADSDDGARAAIAVMFHGIEYGISAMTTCANPA
jgi:hypothetical protein